MPLLKKMDEKFGKGGGWELISMLSSIIGEAAFRNLSSGYCYVMVPPFDEELQHRIYLHFHPQYTSSPCQWHGSI